MIEKALIYKTQSLCPVCLKKINALIVLNNKEYVMKKRCPVHGNFESVVWKGRTPMEDWKIHKEKAVMQKPLTEVSKGCPYDCGLCGEHRQHTCTALIEVTQRCNLNCRFCFADAKTACRDDPTAEQINELYKIVMNTSGNCNIQLSGGEPTLRDDLPLLIQNGKELGFHFIQVNTNGIRLALEEPFVEKLKTAGLNSLFLQFDGTKDTIYRTLRGRNLLDLKIQAIENCQKHDIGVILVPTLVPHVNVDNIGEIIDFALEHIRTVRGVHFQPVSYFGRIPHTPQSSDRVTLAEVMDEIEKQTKGRVKVKSLKPPQCENSFCSFHGRYLYQENGNLLAIGSGSTCNCHKDAETGAAKAKVFVSQNWASRKPNDSTSTEDGWDKILNTINQYSFSISAMAFQDVWNVDIHRVKDCCIHVVSPEGKLIPFCLYNITDSEGRSLYRGNNQVK